LGTQRPRLFVDGAERTVVLDAAPGPRPAEICHGGNVARVLTNPPSRQTWRYERGWASDVRDEVVLACAIDAQGNEAWATSAGVRFGDRRLEVLADQLVFVRNVLVTVAGREVRAWAADGRELGRHTLDFEPAHVVADEQAVFVARGRRLLRLVVSELATESVAVELAGDVVALGVGPTLAVATNAVERPGARLGNHYVEDAVLVLDRETLAPLEVHRTARRSRRQDHPGAVDSGLLPRALVWRGGWRVAFAGSGELGELGGLGRTTRLPRALGAPTAFAILDDGTRLVVSAGQAGAWSEGWSLVGEEGDPGERAFFAATRSGLACASCHVEGGQARHRLGPAEDEARAAHVAPPIANLRETPPYFRDGAYPTLDALVEEGVHLFGGHRTPNGALVPWLRNQTRGASLDDVDATREGWRVFSEEGCPRCHAPPAFTDGVMRTRAELEDEGAVLRDTPSLVGLRERSELGHDLRASDVPEFLRRASGAHRVRSASRPALRRFLEAL
ncbi:MAG: hypothetical protein KC586_29760, partial [Myxococcales bacterium]|nr:hypothetical protein [Myxococcales bacterium]